MEVTETVLYLCLTDSQGEPHSEKGLSLNNFALFKFTDDPPLKYAIVQQSNALSRFKCTEVLDKSREPCDLNGSLVKFITSDFDSFLFKLRPKNEDDEGFDELVECYEEGFVDPHLPADTLITPDDPAWFANGTEVYADFKAAQVYLKSPRGVWSGPKPLRQPLFLDWRAPALMLYIANFGSDGSNEVYTIDCTAPSAWQLLGPAWQEGVRHFEKLQRPKRQHKSVGDEDAGATPNGLHGSPTDRPEASGGGAKRPRRERSPVSTRLGAMSTAAEVLVGLGKAPPLAPPVPPPPPAPRAAAASRAADGVLQPAAGGGDADAAGTVQACCTAWWAATEAKAAPLKGAAKVQVYREALVELKEVRHWHQRCKAAIRAEEVEMAKQTLLEQVGDEVHDWLQLAQAAKNKDAAKAQQILTAMLTQQADAQHAQQAQQATQQPGAPAAVAVAGGGGSVAAAASSEGNSSSQSLSDTQKLTGHLPQQEEEDKGAWGDADEVHSRPGTSTQQQQQKGREPPAAAKPKGSKGSSSQPNKGGGGGGGAAAAVVNQWPTPASQGQQQWQQGMPWLKDT